MFINKSIDGRNNICGKKISELRRKIDISQRELAEKLHKDMTYYSYGLALLANTGHLNLTDEELLASFRREFMALAAYYDVSPVPLRFRKQEK